jgi:putative DNA primase/helicase
LDKPAEKSRKDTQPKPQSSSRSGSIAAAITGGLKDVPPFTDYERAKLEDALWYHENDAWILDPRDPHFAAWENVLYPLSWLGHHGWPWEYLEDLFDRWSAEGGEQGAYPGRAECVRRLRGAKNDKDNPKTVYTIYGLVRQRGWTEPPIAVQVQPETNAAPIRTPRFSDDHLALEFVNRHGHELRYVAPWGRWYRYDGTCWRRDETLNVYDLARVSNRDLARVAKKVAKQVASAKTRAAVEQLSRADRRVAATVDQWDADPWLLNTPGGVVDLRTGDVRPHRPDDYMTKITAVAPDFTNRCPKLWLKFLHRITNGDAALVDFHQQSLGYALTGVTKEHVLFFWHGTGRNGKGVTTNTITGIFGDYHEVVPIEALTASNTDRHPTELAKLCGARLVTATETIEGRRWDETKIKMLTGGDEISARFMRQDFFDYVPQFKLIIQGNHKPGLRSVDEAIKSRFNLVPFMVTIPREERDLDLAEKLKAEWPGILAWMIDGCVAWQRIGLKPPPAVQEATEEYLAAQDLIALWLDECCERDRRAWTASESLFGSWTTWAERAGEPIGRRKDFVEQLVKRFGEQVRKEAGMGFNGVKVKPPASPVAAAATGGLGWRL